MQITLSKKLEEIVRSRMKSGQYATPDAVVAEALVLLDQRPPDWTAADLKRGIDEGLKDFDEGRYLELNEVGLRRFLDDVKTRVADREPDPSHE